MSSWLNLLFSLFSVFFSILRYYKCSYWKHGPADLFHICPLPFTACPCRLSFFQILFSSEWAIALMAFGSCRVLNLHIKSICGARVTKQGLLEMIFFFQLSGYCHIRVLVQWARTIIRFTFWEIFTFKGHCLVEFFPDYHPEFMQPI